MNGGTIAELLPEGLSAPIAPDRGGYTVTMRESAGTEEVLAALASENVTGERIHVGWGSFRNLDVAAARRSSGVLLLDINLHQFRVWDAVRAALVDPTCTDAGAFVDLVEPVLPKAPRLRQFVPSTRDWLLADHDRPGSWLGGERFEWVRELFRENRAATGCMDLRDGGDLFARFAERLDGAKLDTLYVSNLPWMLAQGESFFGEIVQSGPAEVARARANLALIAPRFAQVIEAGHLAADSTPGDLQWQTRALAPAVFLADDYWTALEPAAGPFRSLS
jgi:hypothetical protein